MSIFTGEADLSFKLICPKGHVCYYHLPSDVCNYFTFQIVISETIQTMDLGGLWCLMPFSTIFQLYRCNGS